MMMKCNDNKAAAPLVFSPNMRLRIYLGCTIGHIFYKRCCAVTTMQDHGFRWQLILIEADDGRIVMLYGTGHQRMSCKTLWRQHLGTETPTFQTMMDFYATRDDIPVETIKDKRINP